MIPRIKTGASFKGAELYYLHDKRQDGEKARFTQRRVAWAHTENTLSDDPAEAFAEMRKTSFDQPMLKHLSGNRTDGRPTDRPVMTISLAWAPDQEPTKEHMIATGRDFLKAMGWEDHQAVFVGHQDTKHPHFHIILNKVHPETGMTLDQSWTNTRAQKWGLAYERQQGHIYCKAREERYGHGRDVHGQHMNRWEWQTWQQISREAKLDREFQPALKAGEWEALKEGQKQERLAFWKQTGQMRKELRASVRAEVREEFRPSWRIYAEYRDKRQKEARAYDKEARRAIRHYIKLGGRGHSDIKRQKAAVQAIRERRADYHKRLDSDLAEFRNSIIAQQNTRIAELAPPALDRLSKDRVQVYEQIKERHRAERAQLSADQKQGKRRRDVLTPRPSNQNTGQTFTVNTGQALSPQQSLAYKEHAKETLQLKQDIAGARNEVAPRAGSPPAHAGATPAQRKAAIAQAHEQQKAPAPQTDAPKPARRVRRGKQQGELTDAKLAKKKARAANANEARERALDEAILEGWGVGMEYSRTRGRGGRER